MVPAHVVLNVKFVRNELDDAVREGLSTQFQFVKSGDVDVVVEKRRAWLRWLPQAWHPGDLAEQTGANVDNEHGTQRGGIRGVGVRQQRLRREGREPILERAMQERITPGFAFSSLGAAGRLLIGFLPGFALGVAHKVFAKRAGTKGQVDALTPWPLTAPDTLPGRVRRTVVRVAFAINGGRLIERGVAPALRAAALEGIAPCARLVDWRNNRHDAAERFDGFGLSAQHFAH